MLGYHVLTFQRWGDELPQTILKQARVRESFIDIDTNCGPWRAPGSNTNAFVEQSFIHELAVLAGRDHVEFLIEILGERRWTKRPNCCWARFAAGSRISSKSVSVT